LNIKFKKLVYEGIIFQGLTALLSFAWVSLSAHHMNASELGIFLVCLSILSSIVMLCGLGIQHSITIKAGSNSEFLIVSNGFLAIFALAVLASLITYAVAILTPYQIKTGLSAFFAASASFFLFVQVYSNSLLRAIHRFREANLLSIVQPVLFNMLIVLLIALRAEVSVQNALVLYVTSLLISSALTVFVIFLMGYFRYSEIKIAVFREVIGYGGRIQVGNILKEVMYKADLYIVSWLLGSAAAGLYAVVLKVLEGVGRFVDALGLVMLPFIAKYSDKERNQLTTSIILVVLPITLVIAVFVSGVSNSLVIVLFGVNFSGSSELMEWGIFALPMLAIWKILANDYIGRGLIKAYILSSAFGAAIITFGNFLLLPYFGVNVAPLVLLLSYSIALATIIIAGKTELNIFVNSIFTGNQVNLINKVEKNERVE
jgi:O-antigen/teichoic acid export membrane protein